MTDERTNKSTSRELNIVLKELRRAQQCSTEDGNLRDKVADLTTEVAKLKSTLSVAAAAVVVFWAVCSSLILGGISEWSANSREILDHKYRIEAQEAKINRLHKERS